MVHCHGNCFDCCCYCCSYLVDSCRADCNKHTSDSCAQRGHFQGPLQPTLGDNAWVKGSLKPALPNKCLGSPCIKKCTNVLAARAVLPKDGMCEEGMCIEVTPTEVFALATPKSPMDKGARYLTKWPGALSPLCSQTTGGPTLFMHQHDRLRQLKNSATESIKLFATSQPNLC
jgi:hypothetical protein